MRLTGDAARQPEPPKAGGKRTPAPAAAPRAPKSGRRRLLLVVLAVVVVGLAWGGYRVSRELSGVRHLRAAKRAMDDGNTPAALAELGECHRAWPNDPEIHLLLARTHWMAGNRAETVRHLDACKAAGGDAARVALETQLAAASTGALEPVEATLRGHVEAAHPDRAVILEALVRGLVARARAEDAERFATLWVDAAPERWQPWFYRGLARTLLSKDLLSTAHAGAKSDFARALEIKPDHDVARFLLGNAFVMSGQFRDALPHLEEYARQKPDDPAGAVALAGCHRSLARVEDARRVLDDWLTAHAGTPEAFLLRGEIALDLGRPQEALEFLRRSETLAPGNEKTDFQIAQALRALGQADEAAKYEAKWRERGELKERLKTLEETAAREPGNAAARHEAGTIALRLGDEPAAMRWFAEALKRDPAPRPTHETLAAHFEKKGNREAAAFHRKLAQQPPR
jgi:tetratricopeptide (TPR) repeat protein